MAVVVLEHALLLWAPVAFGHGGSRPVGGAPGLGGILGRVKGGYGYVMLEDLAYSPALQGTGREASEAGAMSVIEFGCEDADRTAFVRRACGDLPAGTDLDALVRDTMAPIVLQRFRDKAFEHQTLLRAAAITDQSLVLRSDGTPIRHFRASSSEPAILTAPSGCVSAESTGHLANAPGILTRDLPTEPDVISGFFGEPGEHSLMARHYAVLNQLGQDNLIGAVALFDQLTFLTSPPACSGTQSNNNCDDMRNTLARLDQSYPSLFGTSAARPAATRDAQIQEIRDSVALALGTDTSPAASESARLEAGRTYYRDRTQSSATNSLRLLDERLARVYERFFTNPPPPPAALEPAIRRLMGSTEAIKTDQAARAEADLAEICGMDLDTFIRRNPNVVRQALLDMSERERAAAKAVLCRSPALAGLRFARNCYGVSGGPIPAPTPTAVTVSRTNFSWPYASSENYTIARESSDPSSPYVLTTTVYIKRDSQVPAPEAATLRSQWETLSQGWMNCQAGTRPPPELTFPESAAPGAASQTVSCPPTGSAAQSPPFRFEVKFVEQTSPPGQPEVSLHRCWRTEVAASNCTATRNFVLNECAAGCRASLLCRNRCATSTNPATGGVPAWSDPRNNREDSANYTSNTSTATVFHEVGHVFGLPDEYESPEYTFSPQGEHDSLMNGGAPGRLFPRHFRKMIEPAQECVGAGGGTP